MDATEICPLNRDSIELLLNDDRFSQAQNTGHERRREARWPFPGTVELWLPMPAGEEDYVLATCNDLSFGGVGIRIGEELVIGQEMAIAIHQPQMSVHGRAIVRHCRPIDDGHYAGLEFVFD